MPPSSGTLEAPINPLMYVLAYGAGFVAQGTPADMAGLAVLIEEAIRFPGFAFVNVQSPGATYGEPDQPLQTQKARIQDLRAVGHDPADWLHGMDLAREYSTKLYTGVFYKNPTPAPTLADAIKGLQDELMPKAMARKDILSMFAPRL